MLKLVKSQSYPNFRTLSQFPNSTDLRYEDDEEKPRRVGVGDEGHGAGAGAAPAAVAAAGAVVALRQALPEPERAQLPLVPQDVLVEGADEAEEAAVVHHRGPRRPQQRSRHHSQ